MYESYCRNWENANKVVDELISTNKKFDAVLKKCGSSVHVGKFGLQQLLITPIQRIMRYKMLLDAILRHLPNECPLRSSLQAKIVEFSQLAQKIDKAKNEEKLVQISKKFKKKHLDVSSLKNIFFFQFSCLHFFEANERVYGRFQDKVKAYLERREIHKSRMVSFLLFRKVQRAFLKTVEGALRARK